MTVEIKCETSESVIKHNNHKEFTKFIDDIWNKIERQKTYTYGHNEYSERKSIYAKEKVLKFFKREVEIIEIYFDGNKLQKTDLHTIQIYVYGKQHLNFATKYAKVMKTEFEKTEYNIKIQIIKEFLE